MDSVRAVIKIHHGHSEYTTITRSMSGPVQLYLCCCNNVAGVDCPSPDSLFTGHGLTIVTWYSYKGDTGSG